MASEKFILVSTEDEKIKILGDVLSNKTCKKIIDHLADDEEASQKDLADALNVPISTIDYSMKKLLKSGFIQKKSNFFWSKKGKKIVMYELSKKSIVISPRKSNFEKLKSILPALMITFVGTFALYVYEKIQGIKPTYSSVQSIFSEKLVEEGDSLIEVVPSVVGKSGELISSSIPEAWFWFFLGGLLVLGIVSFVNWKKL